MEDRVEALGGTLELADDATASGDVRSGGCLVAATSATVELTGRQRPAVAAAHSWPSRSGPNDPFGT